MDLITAEFSTTNQTLHALTSVLLMTGVRLQAAVTCAICVGVKNIARKVSKHLLFSVYMVMFWMLLTWLPNHGYSWFWLQNKQEICSDSTNLCRSGGSGFRTLDSRIRSVIRIATKIVLLGPWAMPYPSKKFRQNPFTSLRVIRRTDRQTDRQTNRPNQKHNLLLRRR